MPINHYTETTNNGRERVFATYTEDVAECDECETDEYLFTDEYGQTICSKCGLVLTDKIFVDSYTKPQIKYKTPAWRKPKVYDTKFFDLMEKYTDNNTRFNYTRPGSKNREQDGYYNRYKSELNNEELVINDNCFEQGRLVACSIDTFGRSLYGDKGQ